MKTKYAYYWEPELTDWEIWSGLVDGRIVEHHVDHRGFRWFRGTAPVPQSEVDGADAPDPIRGVGGESIIFGCEAPVEFVGLEGSDD